MNTLNASIKNVVLSIEFIGMFVRRLELVENNQIRQSCANQLPSCHENTILNYV